MRRIIYGLFIVFLCVGAAYAQTASVIGSITDPSGAVVPQASVQLVNQNTRVTMTATSNSAGTFTFPFVTPGLYTITVQKMGFKTSTRPDITLSVAHTAEVNFTLEVGAAEQTVKVSGGAAQINTTDAAVSTVIDRHFLQTLPLNGRSFQSLLYLTPGVMMNLGPGATGANNGTQGQFVVNGQRPDTSYWTIDGVSGNIGMAPNTPGPGAAGAIGATNSLGGTSALISVDALQEFRVVTSTHPPEFGHASGGQVIIESRSGTDQFHGALFDYLRNTNLDATDWFANHFGLPKAAEIQNDFGGVLGGPIVRNRTFFFFSYEGLRLHQPYTQVSTVPSMAARAAALSSNKPFLDMYPTPAPGAPETAPGSGLSPYSATFSNPSTADAFSLRVDDQLTRNLHFFARYNHAPSTYAIRGGSFAANDVSRGHLVTKTATAGLTWVLSPQVVNNTRFNYSVSGAAAIYTMDDFGGGTPPPPSYLPSPHDFSNSLFAYIPVIGSGMSEYAAQHGSNYQHQHNLVDNVSIQKGSHSLKFGIDYRRLTPDYGQTPYELIPIFFSIEEMQTGLPLVTVVSHYSLGRFLFQNLGLYGQDTWRVTPRFNLTYGLRWQVDYSPQTLEGTPLPGLTGWNLNDMSQVKQVPGKPAFKTSYGNVAPRIGGAYRILTQPGRELVLRGGFGVFYNMASSQVVNGLAMNEPLYPYGTNAFYFSNPFPIAPTDPAAQTPAMALPTKENSNQMFGLDPNLKLPYALEWNAALEQSLGPDQTLTLSYIGSLNRRQITSANIAHPDSQYYAALYLIGNAGKASYSALQAQFQRRLSHGLQTLASYTWSHCIDDGSFGSYANGPLTNVSENKGDCDYDVRNAFDAALTYNFPTWDTNAFARVLTRGWSTDNIVQAFSGPPIDINDGNFANLEVLRAAAIIRPDRVASQPLYLHGPQYAGGKALNPAAFKDPPTVFDPEQGGLVPARQGDLGRNAIRAFGLVQWNFALHREFSVTERLKLQFRAEFFNLLNHPNFGPFNSAFTATNPLFGQSTQMLATALGGNQSLGAQSALYQPGGSRSGQLALKLTF